MPMKLSIITVNKNNDIGLERTSQSVACQTFEDFEWIVIDGASTDNSVDIIKSYADKMSYWVSEPDTGIYNAMNKGIRQAKGEYCLFLNSGDWLVSLNSLKKAFDIINDLDYADFYYGDCLVSDNSMWKMPHELSIDNIYLLNAPSHQNTLIKRSLFYDHEFYAENYRTVSDSIFFLKEFCLHHSKFVYINTIISIYNLGGISSAYKLAKQELHEEMKKILDDTEFNIIKKRCTTKSIDKIKKSIKNIIKFLLPYGLVLIIKNYKSRSRNQVYNESSL
jgi:glycosyltransferase involved in cell wall biosynthesis